MFEGINPQFYRIVQDEMHVGFGIQQARGGTIPELQEIVGRNMGLINQAIREQDTLINTVKRVFAAEGWTWPAHLQEGVGGGEGVGRDEHAG